MKNINDKHIKKILKALDDNDYLIIGGIYLLAHSSQLEKCFKGHLEREIFCDYLQEEIYNHAMNEKTIARILRRIDEENND